MRAKAAAQGVSVAVVASDGSRNVTLGFAYWYCNDDTTVFFSSYYDTLVPFKHAFTSYSVGLQWLVDVSDDVDDIHSSMRKI